MVRKLTFDTDHWDKWLAGTNEVTEDGNALVSYDTAKQYLRNAERYRCRYGHRQMQIMFMPRSNVWKSYEIFMFRDYSTEARKIRYFLLRTICQLQSPQKSKKRGLFRRRLNRDSNSGFIPELIYEHVEIDKAFFEEILGLFRFQIPVFPEIPKQGFDGAFYELFFEVGFQRVRYVWWSTISPDWTQLQTNFAIARDKFEELFN